MLCRKAGFCIGRCMGVDGANALNAISYEGWYYLSTVLADHNRYIISWDLTDTMSAEDVKTTLERAITETGVDDVKARDTASDVIIKKPLSTQSKLNRGRAASDDTYRSRVVIH